MENKKNNNLYQLLLFWSKSKSCWTKASPPYIEHNWCLKVNAFGNQLEHEGKHLYDPFCSAAIQIQLEDRVCDFSSKMCFLNGCVACGGTVSADLALCFFNHDIPQAVLGTQTDNMKVMKRSRSNIVLMCNWLCLKTEGRKIRREMCLGCSRFSCNSP